MKEQSGLDCATVPTHIDGMKLHITKGRAAIVAAVLPVLYLLNGGPALYAWKEGWVSGGFIKSVYTPGFVTLRKTPLWKPYRVYLRCWTHLSPKPDDFG